MQLELVNGALVRWRDDIKVKIRGQNGQIRIRYFLDRRIAENVDLYALKITRRIALILQNVGDGTDPTSTTPGRRVRLMKRAGLMIVVKPDTKSWEEVSEEQDVKIL